MFKKYLFFVSIILIFFFVSTNFVAGASYYISSMGGV